MHPIYVIGHHQPDTNSIGSVLGYAELLTARAQGTYTPAYSGDLNAETRYALAIFGIDAPVPVTSGAPLAIHQVFEELSRAFGFKRPEDIFSNSTFYGNQFRSFQFKGHGFTGKGFFFFGPMSETYQNILRDSHYQTSKTPAGRPSLFSKMLLRGMHAFQHHVAKK